MTTNNSLNAPLPLVIAQGGTGASTQSAALSAILGSSAVPIANGGTGETTQSAALTALLGSSLVPVANGGTGAATLTQNGILLGNGTSAVSAATALTNGQLLIGATGGAPVPATLTAGAGIAISNASGAVTIAATGAGFVWNTVSGTTQALAPENGYISTGTALTTYTLPATAAVGDEYFILSSSTNTSFSAVAQNAGQTIQIGNQKTTAGTGGSLTGTAVGDTLHLICVVANTGFQVVNMMGNFTVV